MGHQFFRHQPDADFPAEDAPFWRFSKMIEQGIDAGCPILQYQIVDMIRQILPVVVAACVAPCFAAEGWITDMDAAKNRPPNRKRI